MKPKRPKPWVHGILLCSFLSAAAAGDEVRWFVVSEIPPVERNQSYLLPLSDPDEIAQARQLIAEGPGGSVGSIVSARLVGGSDGFNRDVRAPGGPLWSWHVTELLGFADLTIELCDGWPGLVEEDVDGFIANTGATVCFWGYTITEELESAPGYRATRLDSGAWFNPATSGQGILFEVLEEIGQLFAAWFTFAPQAAKVGAPEHRWLTAQGELADGAVDLEVSVTAGGAFDSPQPVMTEPAGTLRLEFLDCNHILARYELDEVAGEFPLERILPRADCEPR